MTSRKQTHLDNVRSIRNELFQLLDGMDYCLDWKSEPDSWSARQVIYHLVDTPVGGVHSVIGATLSDSLREFDLWSDLDHVTPERQSHDAERVRQDIGRVLDGLEESVKAALEEDFEGKSVLTHFKARDVDEEFTAQRLLEGMFGSHWHEHLDQIRDLRETLGV